MDRSRYSQRSSDLFTPKNTRAPRIDGWSSTEISSVSGGASCSRRNGSAIDDFDIRYMALIGLLMFYMFLTGNRFSAFYSYGSFFILPLSAVIAVEAGNIRGSRSFLWMAHACKRRDLIAFGVIACLITVGITIGIYNNLANVRGYEQAAILPQFLERALIQPSELGWLSYQRVFELNHWQPYRTFDFLFQMPLDAGRNTTPQYLMLQSIGEPRTYEHISAGAQFAGGFPEIYFELFGPFYAWPFIFGAGYIAAGLTALIVKGVILGPLCFRVSGVLRPVRFFRHVYRRNAQFRSHPDLLAQGRRFGYCPGAGKQPCADRIAAGSVVSVSHSKSRLAEVGSATPFSLTRASKSPRENRMTEHVGAPSLFKSDDRIQETHLAAGHMILCGFCEDSLC